MIRHDSSFEPCADMRQPPPPSYIEERTTSVEVSYIFVSTIFVSTILWLF